MLSQFVIKCLDEFDQGTGDIQFSAVRYFEIASENAKEEEDKKALNVLSGALSMGYSNENDNYVPQAVMADGRRTFAMEDLDDSGIETLKETLPHFTSAWVKAQLSDIIWVRTCEQPFAQTAVEENLRLFNESFDPNEWVVCYHAVRRAFQIALKPKIKNNSFSTVLQQIDSTIQKMENCNGGFLPLKLIEMVVPYISEEKQNQYLISCRKIFDKSIVDATTEPIVRYSVDIQCELLKKLKRQDEIHPLQLELARYYEKTAAESARHPYQAIQMLLCAYSLYDRRLDREKRLDIHKRIEELQHARLYTMSSIPIKYDLTPIHSQLDSLFHGLSRQEMIVEYGRIALIYDIADVRRGVLEDQRKNVFLNLLSKRIMDEEGRVIKIIPPLDFHEPEKEPNLLHEHMVAYVTDRRNLGESISLGIAYSYIQRQGGVENGDLDFLIDDNAIIPDDRKDIVKLGLSMGLNNELYAAMHILLPQTENIIRNLAKMCGDTITYLKEDGTEEFKPLSQLLNAENLRESYDENVLFTLETLLDERGGPNLRNENAHGILSPAKGSSGAALCFLSLLIRFLSLYSCESAEVLHKLLQR